MNKLLYYIWCLVFIHFPISEAQEKSHRDMIEELQAQEKSHRDMIEELQAQEKSHRDMIEKLQEIVREIREKLKKQNESREKTIENLEERIENVWQTVNELKDFEHGKLRQLIFVKASSKPIETMSKEFSLMSDDMQAKLTTKNSLLTVFFNVSVLNGYQNSLACFGIFVDGVLVDEFRGAYIYVNNTWAVENIGGSTTVEVDPGIHTVELRWRTTGIKPLGVQVKQLPGRSGQGLKGCSMHILEVQK